MDINDWAGLSDFILNTNRQFQEKLDQLESAQRMIEQQTKNIADLRNERDSMQVASDDLRRKMEQKNAEALTFMDTIKKLENQVEELAEEKK